MSSLKFSNSTKRQSAEILTLTGPWLVGKLCPFLSIFLPYLPSKHFKLYLDILDTKHHKLPITFLIKVTISKPQTSQKKKKKTTVPKKPRSATPVEPFDP